MRILLDECVPHRLRNHLPQHECQTAQRAGFGGLENGELLEAAENAKFDVLVTVDRGIEYQQDFGNRKIAMVILCALKDINIDTLEAAIRYALAAQNEKGKLMK
jgi:predicted nuclease of predicted toxin-antitoxin system